MSCNLRHGLQVLIQLTVVRCLTNVIFVGILPRRIIHVNAQEVRMRFDYFIGCRLLLMVVVLSLVSHSKMLLLTLLRMVEISLVSALELELLFLKYYVINR